MTLNDLKINHYGVVREVNTNKDIKRRLLDIGLTPGTKVESVLENIGKNLKAFMIRGALIALRNEDSKDVLVDIYD